MTATLSEAMEQWPFYNCATLGVAQLVQKRSQNSLFCTP